MSFFYLIFSSLYLLDQLTLCFILINEVSTLGLISWSIQIGSMFELNSECYYCFVFSCIFNNYKNIK